MGACGEPALGGVPGQVCVQRTLGLHRIHFVCLDLGAGWEGTSSFSSSVCYTSLYTLNKLKGIYMQVGFGL